MRDRNGRLDYLSMLLPLIGALGIALFLYKSSSWVVDLKQAPEVAVLIPGDVPFFRAQLAAMHQRARSLGMRLRVFDAGWEAAAQLRQLQNVVTMSNIDAVLWCSVDGSIPVDVRRLTRETQTPLITFTNALGSDVTGKAAGIHSHVGRNEYEAGRLLGQQVLAFKASDKPLRVWLLAGDQQTTPVKLRERGFRDIAEGKDWTVAPTIYVKGWNVGQIGPLIESRIRLGEQADVVAALWAGAATAAQAASKTLAPTKRFEVVSLEYTRDIRAALRAGTVTSTTYASVREEGENAIEQVRKVLDGRATLAFVRTSERIIKPADAETLAAEM